MSGEAGNEPASVPIATVDRSGALKARIWLGLPLVIIGGYLLGDTGARLQLACNVLVAWWPWALLVLAGANVLRSVLRLESLLAPGVLTFVALVALGIRRGVGARTLVDITIPAAIALAGVVLLLSVGSWLTESWTRILVSGRMTARELVSGGLRPRAILGELKADLSALAAPPEEVRVTAVFGHVQITIPDGWRLKLHGSGALLTPVRGQTGTGPPEVTLRVLGFCGVVSVVRAGQPVPVTRDGAVA